MGAAASINGGPGGQGPSILTIDAGKAEVRRLLLMVSQESFQLIGYAC